MTTFDGMLTLANIDHVAAALAAVLGDHPYVFVSVTEGDPAGSMIVCVDRLNPAGCLSGRAVNVYRDVVNVATLSVRGRFRVWEVATSQAPYIYITSSEITVRPDRETIWRIVPIKD